ncbi:endoplasmic reticulum resident protein 44-like [Cherax quadricarinatus]|uniref:endoplasmic reticulum resident protein 44-like n=1 Tax=Cherax quadricarinatus TaxID=27406 RepID=UPI002378D7AC|nr:endoplasmic reticulum resident protein 44-like [Cherax quadricarinatus]
MLDFTSLHLLLSLLTVVVQFTRIQGGALQLDSSNFDSIIGNNELVFINFYADWCRFSNILAPTWDETADKVQEIFPDKGRVVIGKVDCDTECEYSMYFMLCAYYCLG